MFYVYLLRSKNNSRKTYISYTTDLKARLSRHNAGGSPHTADDRPWKVVTYTAFDEKEKALSFEKYLKVGFGVAFAKKGFGN